MLFFLFVKLHIRARNQHSHTFVHTTWSIFWTFWPSHNWLRLKRYTIWFDFDILIGTNPLRMPSKKKRNKKKTKQLNGNECDKRWIVRQSDWSSFWPKQSFMMKMVVIIIGPSVTSFPFKNRSMNRQRARESVRA